MKTSNNLENKTLSDTYGSVQLVCKKVQAHSFYNCLCNTVMTRHLWQIKFCYDLFKHLGSYRNILQFQTSSGRENRLKIPESSGLEFLETFSANNFALSDVQDNISGPLNRGGIADLLLLRTLLAIHQTSQEHPLFY